MSRLDLFPDAHRDGQEARASSVWSLDYPLPVPARHRPLRCPCCGIGDMVLKDWRFHKQTSGGSKHPWRCDVRLKCCTCGHVPIFGLVIPRSYFEAGNKGSHRSGWIGWREGKERLAEAGYFEEG